VARGRLRAGHGDYVLLVDPTGSREALARFAADIKLYFEV